MSGYRLFVFGWVAVFGLLAGCGRDQPAQDGATPSIERGMQLFLQCRYCHSLNEGGPNKVGPNLYGIFGRKAGTAPGFAYSDALTHADVVWTAKTLDEWLARPSQFLPGNLMMFPGIKDAGDRANLIAYLRQETGAK